MDNKCERIELYPVFNRYAVYNDHYAGELSAAGDALGRDCMIAAMLPEDLGFMRLYRGDGSKNEDWFSFGEKVFSPVSGRVKEVYINPVTNEAGKINSSRASCIVIDMADGTQITLAHIEQPLVKVGDAVEEGQFIARVGNNGCSRNPHLHIGAFKGGKPLMVGFDAEKVAAVRGTVDDCYWIAGISGGEFTERIKNRNLR